MIQLKALFPGEEGAEFIAELVKGASYAFSVFPMQA